MIEIYHETLATNCFKVRFGWLNLYFSYETLVGISVGWKAVFVGKGISRTTSKHLKLFLARIGDVENNVRRMPQERLIDLAELLRDKVMTQLDQDRIDEIHAFMGFEDVANRI